MTALFLPDLFPLPELDAAIRAGHIRAQTSSDGYRIFNYTEAAVWARAWTPVTLVCRGLIVDHQSRVVARPFPKFFNHGEPSAPPLSPQARVEATDKLDGSLGILHSDADGRPRIATRGSFTSDQARHATDLYRRRYGDRWTVSPGVTYLFEIVYPANRIVLDYGATDDLILLGAVDIVTGTQLGPESPECQGWPGPRAAVFEHRTLAEALTAPSRPNAEGIVVRYLDGPDAGAMLKIKQADYLALHSILTGLNARRVWEHAAVWAVRHALGDTHPVRQIAQQLRLDPVEVQGIVDAGPQWRDDLARSVPEEFTAWIDATAAALTEQAAAITKDVAAVAAQYTDMPRRDVAAATIGHPHRALVFATLDRRPIIGQAWAAIRPAADKPCTPTEDTA